jgi:hypothetical protein
VLIDGKGKRVKERLGDGKIGIYVCVERNKLANIGIMYKPD